MKSALNIVAHQLRLPVKTREIMIAVVVISSMTLAMGYLEFTHRRTWIGPALNIAVIFAVVQLIVYLILLQRRIRGAKHEHRHRPPPGEMIGAGVPIGPRRPGPLSAHAVPPRE